MGRLSSSPRTLISLVCGILKLSFPASAAVYPLLAVCEGFVNNLLTGRIVAEAAAETAPPHKFARKWPIRSKGRLKTAFRRPYLIQSFRMNLFLKYYAKFFTFVWMLWHTVIQPDISRMLNPTDTFNITKFDGKQQKQQTFFNYSGLDLNQDKAGSRRQYT